ncbi:MAG TPA: MFS transporter [Acidimicrobiales bacterium]|nr:MFS transporter [Acidimicrobiales bacterium]
MRRHFRREARPGNRAPLPAGFGTIWSTVALDLVGFGIILPILPQYAEEFGASPAVVGALFASFSVAQLLCAPLWGSVSDKVGRKPVLILSLVGTALGSLLTGLAGSLPLLFAGRILDGASGASVSVAQAAVADLAPRDQRARLFGLLSAAFGVGFVAGPALGALAALGGTRLPFLVAAGLAGANAIAAIFRLPETKGHVAEPEEPVVAVDKRPRGLVELVAVAFVSLLAFSAFEATFSLFGERRFDLGPASIGAVFTAIGIVLVLVQTSLVHPTVKRLGEIRTLQFALAANAAGLMLLAAAHSWWALVPALLALVVGQGLAMPSLTSAFSVRVSVARRGGALGIQQSATGLARVVGPVAGGLAFQHIGIPAPYVGGALLMVLCAAVVSTGSLRDEKALT